MAFSTTRGLKGRGDGGDGGAVPVSVDPLQGVSGTQSELTMVTSKGNSFPSEKQGDEIRSCPFPVEKLSVSGWAWEAFFSFQNINTLPEGQSRQMK